MLRKHRLHFSLPLKSPVAFLLLSGLFFSTSLFAQRISLHLTNEPLEKAFQLIREQTGTKFLYTRKQLQQSKPVTINIVDVELNRALAECFTDQALEWEIINGTVVVKPKKQLHKRVSGTVTSNGKPLAGVSIVFKGTDRGTTTDEEGHYVLNDADNNSTLVFTSIGYEVMEKPAKGSTIDVDMTTQSNDLDQAVVIGYGKTTRRLTTGSVSRVTAKDIGNQPVSNPLAAISGRMSGVMITQQTGVPGGSFSIQIRGKNSVRPDGNNPLYIIDGVPIPSTTLSSTYLSGAIIQGGNPLSTINPEDIESIEILKDGDATAIYGSRGANGVVLITTKKGVAQKTSFDFNYSEGAGKITHFVPMLNTTQYLAMRAEAFSNDGIAPGPADYDVNGTWDKTRYTNWAKVLLGNTAHRRTITGGVKGGEGNTQFLLSATYNKETTVYPGEASNKRVTGHLNVTHTGLDGKFKLMLNSSLGIEQNDLPQWDLISYAIAIPPDGPELLDATKKINWEQSTWDNPLAELLKKYNSRTDNLINNLLISYSPVKGLVLKASLGYTSTVMEETSLTPTTSFRPSYAVSSGFSMFNNGNTRTWIVEPQITYNITRGQNNFQALVGSTAQQSNGLTKAILGSGYASDYFLDNIQAASLLYVLNNNQSVYKYSGIFARLSYNFAEKYLLNLNGRRDGSSRFAPGRQFGTFGAIGAGWIFTEEKLFKQRHLRWLSYGKLRTSYGTTGSDQIPDYGFFDTYSIAPFRYEGASGLVPTRLLNNNFRWELNKKFEAAVELGFFDNRFLISLARYENTSGNQLVGLSLAPTAGFASVQANLPATVRNSGTEFEVSAKVFDSKNFHWSINMNLTWPSNKLISFPNLASSSYANTYEEGKSLNIDKAFHFTGVDPQTGYYTFEDVNKNGSGQDYPDDLQALHSVEQQCFGGVHNTFIFKRWTLDFLVQYVRQTGYNYWLQFLYPPGSFSNQPIYVLDHWKNKGDVSNFQRYTTGADPSAVQAYSSAYSVSDVPIGNSSFMRLKNLQLSFSPLKDALSRTVLKYCRVYLEAQNLLTITKYQGNDPENFRRVELPPLKMMAAGIQLTL